MFNFKLYKPLVRKFSLPLALLLAAGMPAQLLSGTQGEQLPKKWRVTCEGAAGAKSVPIFWTVQKYNKNNGKLDLIVTDRDGQKGTAQGKIVGKKIKMFGKTGKFDKNFNFSINVGSACPGGLLGVAIN